jgi:hypothetical protein
MGEGTTRVVEATGAGARVSELGAEISGVRDQLDTLVTELDRRRHAVMSWPRRGGVRRAGGAGLAIAALAAALLFAPRLITRYWPRRSLRG